MAQWLNLGQTLKVNAKKFPGRISFQDASRTFTYPETNQRVNCIASSLLKGGLKPKDRIALLMENSIEMAEIFLAAAKAGFVVVPINFRLVGPEIEYILNDSEAKALICDHEFAPEVERVELQGDGIKHALFFVNGASREGWVHFDTLIENGSEKEIISDVVPADPWIHIYTSGTTGKPKGVIRSHESHISFYLINAVEFQFNDHDKCMNVMPLCHINSTFYTFTFTYIGGSAYIHPARSFNPEEILKIIERERITFISLIPTHYNLILSLPQNQRNYDVSSIGKLLCSSAPVRKKTKLDIMEFFKGVSLFEAYGSTEAGIVTILKPEDQIKKLGSIGYEVVGTDFVKLLDENKREVDVGEVGELFSKGPMLFDEYYKLEEKTKQSFHRGWFSAGDMAVKDADGFYKIVDRKDNMIITGGENVYPSEVEEAIADHEAVFDCACIGVPDDKWGEKVVAVVILQPNYTEEQVSEEQMRNTCRDKIAGYKVPKKIIYIGEQEMPRTPTGKILHRKLRERFSLQK